MSASEKVLKCIRCGFCLDACPTFRLTGNEADSPRGRIYLMRSVQEETIPLDKGVIGHLDACLACRACEIAQVVHESDWDGYVVRHCVAQ